MQGLGPRLFGGHHLPTVGWEGLEATGWLGFDHIRCETHGFTDSANVGVLVGDRGLISYKTVEIVKRSVLQGLRVGERPMNKWNTAGDFRAVKPFCIL